MKSTFFLLAVACAAPAFADPPFEDAAHRADRLRTEQLNRDAGAAARRRDAASASARDRRYRSDRARYEAEMADWRRRVAACQAGDHAACRP